MTKDEIGGFSAFVGFLGALWGVFASWHYLDGWWGAFPAVVLSGAVAFLAAFLLTWRALSALGKSEP